MVVFSGLSNISSAVFQYRLNANSLGNALVGNFKVSPCSSTFFTLMLTWQWVIFFFFFFCGLSWHLTTALLAHLTGYNMQWSSTVKEVELSHFFKEWPAMWKRFWDIWIVSWVIIVGVAVMASPIVPYAFRMYVSGLIIATKLIGQYQFHLYLANHDSGLLSFPLPHRAQPLVYVCFAYPKYMC